MTDPSILPPLTPIGPGPVYEDVHIWLPQLYAETLRGGRQAIEGRTFRRVRFEGPAVILPSAACVFDACNMGEAGGDIRNLLLAPVGPSKVVGVIPFRDCVFQECAFWMVGFTGVDAFLKQFHANVA